MPVTSVTTPAVFQLPPSELDALFGASPAGEIPAGRSRGTALAFAGTRATGPLSTVARLLFWQGKQFRPATHDLVNLISPFGAKGIRADVYLGDSWYDSKPCVVIDYSKTSRAARRVRDEIRQIAPGRYLGMVFLGERRLGVYFVLDFG